MRQLNYIAGRLLQIIPVLFFVTILIFLMVRFIPGDPAEALLGDKATPDMIEKLREAMGLNRPVYEQYVLFIKRIARFDLGNSLRYGIPVVDLLSNRVPVTVMLTAMATLFGILISFPLGYFAAVRKDTAFDQAVRVWTLLGLTMPGFWVAVLLLLVFGLKLRWFPVGSYGDTMPQHLHSLVLPALTQAIGLSAVWTRNLRNNVVDVLRMDYVAFARSKGVREWDVMTRHVLRNALISTLTLMAISFARMLGGSVITETVFALPGVGKLMVDSIFNRDYGIIQAITFVFALLVMVMNLITDISYSFLDPRVKFE